MIIGGLQKSSLIDYPEKISAIIFTKGCNFRCPYCHNPELINEPKTIISEEDVLAFLKTRINKLDGVVITGGEPTLHKDLPDFISRIKDMGFSLKLDTNGTNPERLKDLIDKNLIDYVAMDIKAPIEKYQEITCTNADVQSILKSIDILKNTDLEFEFRTTVVKSQLLPSDFQKIGDLLKGCPKYYLQRFVPTKTLNQEFMKEQTYTDEEFAPIIASLKTKISNVELR